MKFKDSPNWGQRKKFYGKEAIDIISTIILAKDKLIDCIRINQYPSHTEECSNAKEALDYLGGLDLEDVWMITVDHEDCSYSVILINKDEFYEDYVTFEFGC